MAGGSDGAGGPEGALAVIFDLDGVLTDTAEQHYLGWQRLADEQGWPFDREANEALRGVGRLDSLRRIAPAGLADDRLEELAAQKNVYYVESLADIGPDDALPGARELVVACRDAGLALAIGSSSRNARRVLDALEMTDLFDAITDGASVEAHKPAPDLFLHAAASLGVEPARCVVIEDATSGVEAALAAGMAVVGVGPPERVGAADLVVTHVVEITVADVLALPAAR